MKKTLIHAICLCLVLSLCGAFLLACAETDRPDGKDPTDSTDATATVAPTDEPDKGIDYLLMVPQRTGDKRDFTILTRDNYRYEVYIAEEDVTGELVEEAVFARNARVEEYMNIDIDYMDVSYTWEAMAQVIATVRESVLSSDGAFDMGSTYLAYTATMAVEGLFYNLMELESFHSDSPWWVKGFVDNNIVYDRMYMVVGDLSVSMWQKIYVTFFNKNLANDLGITSELYQAALDQSLTMYQLIEYAAQMSVENGDDVWNDQDTYGLALNASILRAMATSSAVDLTERNADGGYDLCMYNDRSVDIFSQIAEWLKEDSVFVNTKTLGDFSVTNGMFTANQLLFDMTTLDMSSLFRSMDNDFGILPMPKYDDSQETFRAHSFDGFSVFDIPATHEDPAFVASVMEALNAESKQTVIPGYYDVVLKDRTARDKESSDVLDIIRDCLWFDFGFTHYTAMDYMLSYWGDNLVKGATSFASIYESKADSFQTRLETLMDFYQGLY